MQRLMGNGAACQAQDCREHEVSHGGGLSVAALSVAIIEKACSRKR
jgi:hypothetical protein